MKLLKQ